MVMVSRSQILLDVITEICLEEHSISNSYGIIHLSSKVRPLKYQDFGQVWLLDLGRETYSFSMLVK